MARQWDPFWIEAIQTQFIPQINTIVDVLKKRLLPNIRPEDIEAEAEKISDQKWEQFMSMPGTGYEDPADFADKAQTAGISHYGLMYGIRQGLLNSFFENPLLSDTRLFSGLSAMPIYQPLIGDGLYVSLNDIEKYRDNLVRFWHEFADSLQGINQK